MAAPAQPQLPFLARLPAGPSGSRNLPVKNTFIHYDDVDDDSGGDLPAFARRTFSSPSSFGCEKTPSSYTGEDEKTQSSYAGEEDVRCAATSTSSPIAQSLETKGVSLAMHQRRECLPCAYFHLKDDGCRRGRMCDFCHFCTVKDFRHRKAQRRKSHKQEVKRRAAARGRAVSLRSDEDAAPRAPPGDESAAAAGAMEQSVVATELYDRFLIVEERGSPTSSVPVKNTFVHFSDLGEQEPQRARSKSSPPTCERKQDQDVELRCEGRRERSGSESSSSSTGPGGSAGARSVDFASTDEEEYMARICASVVGLR